jgi:hypothetical protein
MVTKQVTCFVVHIHTHDGAPIQANHQSCPEDFLDTLHIEHFSHVLL